VLVVIFLLLIFLEPKYGWQLREWLSPEPSLQADNPSLVSENESLAAELAKLQSIAAQLPNAPTNYLRAMVYSRYPFNFKNEILIDAGTNEGVVQGKAVVFQGIFIGTIVKTYADSSLVQTVFDSNFKMPVRVSGAGYDGLLVGGASPAVESLQKNIGIAAGDIVYAAASSSPYGLPVATISATSTAPDGLFEQASLTFAYDLNTMQTVLIAK
jgi:rod shape-determining protein MreC